MSTQLRRTTVNDLPPELLESLLVVQPPRTVCAIACTSRVLRDAAYSPAVWQRIARRTLRVDASSAKETRAAVDALTFGWWAASGALVRGVPVHFRRRFVAVRQRGAAALVRIRSSSNDAALVMGGPDDGHGQRAPKPALDMDFALDTKGPFPVEGMVVRIVGAPVVSLQSSRSPPASPTRSPTLRAVQNRFTAALAIQPRAPVRSPSFGTSPPRLPPASQLRAQSARRRDSVDSASSFQTIDEDTSATVRVVLNGTKIGEHTVDQLCVFDSVDIQLSPELLRCKPQMNTLTIEYIEEQSNAAFWLKEVRAVPTVLPMSAAPQIENVPLRHVGVSVSDLMYADKKPNGLSPRRHYQRMLGC